MTYFSSKLGDDDDYKPLVDLANTINESTNEKPENAQEMRDDSLGTIKYDGHAEETKGK